MLCSSSSSSAIVSFCRANSLSISASNFPQSAMNSAHSCWRSSVNEASNQAASRSLRPDARNTTSSPPPRAASSPTRAIPAAKPGTSGTAHAPCANDTAPDFRSSRHTATRCREGSAGTRTTNTSHATAEVDTLKIVAIVTFLRGPCPLMLFPWRVRRRCSPPFIGPSSRQRPSPDSRSQCSRRASVGTESDGARTTDTAPGSSHVLPEVAPAKH